MFYNALFSVLLLLISAPIFYIMMSKLYMDDIDESLQIEKNEFQKKYEHQLTKNDILIWNKFNRDILILKDTNGVLKNTFLDAILFDSLNNESEPYRLLYSPIHIDGKNYVLMTRQSLVETEDLVKTIAWLYIFILASLLAGLFIINRNISKQIWKPFYKTLHSIENFSVEKSEKQEFPKSIIYEFNELNTAVNKLMVKSIYSYQAQKEFTENAAHEMQTPLAVFQSKLDILLQNSSLTNEQAQIIQLLYEALARLSRLNKNLLLISKIENNIFDQIEKVNLYDLIIKLADLFETPLEKNNIKFTTVDENFMLNCDKGLLEILITNLLSNAIRYHLNNNEILISISANKLSISNSGNETLDNEKLFKRFSKIGNNTSGNGLGLAIVKTICLKYGWQASYQFVNSLHVFTIRF